MTHPIIVTGPQRSGTRLSAHIIAEKTGGTFIDELDYSNRIPNDAVVQAPFLLKSVLEVSFMFPTAQFAFTYRNKNDIIASMERIEWYKDYIDNSDFYRTYVDHCYDYIEMLKQSLPPERWFDIQYESLAHHPLFVTERANFTVRQHIPHKPLGPATWRNDEYLGSIED